MPARVTIPSVIFPSNTETVLPFTSINGGFLNGNFTIQGNGIRVGVNKLCNVTCQVAFEQNGAGVLNTGNVFVYKNENRISETPYSYNINDLSYISVNLYEPCVAGDVFTVAVKFATASSQIYIPPNALSVFLIVV